MIKLISFIHLSDIHFNKFSGDEYDLDEDLRNEILRDIEHNCKATIGNIDGILVCGDIAFSGQAVEYENALSFLNDVCGILKIPETSVYCVPGNHDVDRSVPKASKHFCGIQQSIENALDIDEIISEYFRDSIFSHMLFAHLEDYNTKFAGKFGCNIDSQKPIWKEDLLLTDRIILRIVGLNSVAISNHHDKDGREMVLGQYQIPKREKGVVFLSLCHHPPSCWKDPTGICVKKMNQRVKLQLYGHNHVQEIEQVGNSLIIGSGATHPPRCEKGWIPRYNWLTMNVAQVNQKDYLIVRVYPRILGEDHDSFVTDSQNCDHGIYSEFLLGLDEIAETTTASEIGSEIEIEELDESVSAKNGQNTEDGNTEIVESLDKMMVRTLVYQFLNLSYLSRCAILAELGLLYEEDEGVNHVYLIEKIIQKSKERGILNQLFEQIDGARKETKYA